MIKTDNPGVVATESISTTVSDISKTVTGRIQDAKSELRPQLQDAWKGVVQVTEAQVTIWGMKAGRAAVMAAFGLMALGLFVALMVAGFVLLDQALAYALFRPDMPWLSPVVRGGVYFLIPIAVFLTIWHAAVGWGTAEEDNVSAKQ